MAKVHRVGRPKGSTNKSRIDDLKEEIVNLKKRNRRLQRELDEYISSDEDENDEDYDDDEEYDDEEDD